MSRETAVTTDPEPTAEQAMQLLQHRTYDAKVYLDGDELVAVGEVTDHKPPGTLVEGDTETVVMHDMVVEMRVSFPDLRITAVSVLFSTYPNEGCPQIAAAYEQLVGLSIARGFTHKVRELLGGPRGCTHVGALLQAMAPAVVQATWSVDRRGKPRSSSDGGAEQARGADSAAMGDVARQAANINTCHIYAEGSERVEMIRKGERLDPPIPVQRRLEALGIDADTWHLD